MLWLSLKALFGVFMLALAGFGCGAWVAKVLPGSCNRVERFGISLLGGFGIFSLALFVIGQISFSRTIIMAALGAATLLSVQPVWRAWRNLRLIPRMISRDAYI